jgi:hypothetical protein
VVECTNALYPVLPQVWTVDLLRLLTNRCISSQHWVNLQRKMLDKILFVVGKYNMNQ